VKGGLCVLGVLLDRRRVLSVLLLASMLATCALVIVVESPDPAIALSSAVDFVGDFETGDLTGFFWNQNKPEIVTAPHPVRIGDYSMRSYLHRYDSKYSYRTMVQVGSQDTNPEGLRDSYTMVIGEEYWVGFSIYVPEDFAPDGDGCGELWFQFQAAPDPGELWRSPVLAINVPQDKYRIKRMWDTREFSPDMSFEGSELLFNGSVLPDRGKWVDWVFHTKWSWQSDGLIEIWKDGIKIASGEGPNCSNDDEGPRISFGVYKWPWKEGSPAAAHCLPSIVERLIYIDEFRIAGAGGSYQEVAPGQSAPADTPTTVPSATPTSTATTTATSTPTVTPTDTPASTATATATSTHVPIPPGDLIANGGFEEGTTNWYFRTDGEGSALTVAPGYTGSQAMEVSIDQEGSTTQLYQYNVPLEPSTSYRLSFAAKSSTGHCIQARIHQHTSPYSDYTGEGYKQFDLTTDWSVQTWSFTTLANAGDDARLRFWFGPCDAGGDMYWIDDVELVEAEAPAAPTSTPTSTATATATSTSSSTATSTPTASPTATQSPTPSSTSTAESTFTATATSTATSTPHPDETVIDDLDPGFATEFSQDAWQQHVQEGGEHFGTSHYYNPQPGSGQDTAVWSFVVDRPGKYDVYAWWWEADWRPPDVPYIINHLGGSTTVRVNQRTDGGTWYPLGVFDFQDEGSVMVSDDVSSGLDVVADAIRLVYRGPLLSATATSTSTPTSTATATPVPANDVTPTPTATQTPVPGEVVVDDLDDGFSESSSQDSWGEYVDPGGRHYGGSHHYNSQVGTGRDTAEWQFTVPRSGFYEVYAWWWEAAWRPPDVPYVVDHLGGSTTVRVDQRTSGGQWNLLGCFYFADRGCIGVSDDVSSGHDVVADAVRLVCLEQSPPGWDRRLFLPVIQRNLE